MDAATIWQIISITGFSISGLLLVVVILMFIKMNIPAIIGDLSGRTAAKHIREIREHNTATGDKRPRPNAFNMERGSLTEPVANSKQLNKSKRLDQAAAHKSKRLDIKNGTGDIFDKSIRVKNSSTETIKKRFSERDQTGALSTATDVLSDDITEVLTEVLSDNNATEVLSKMTSIDENGTDVLALDEGTTILKQTAELKNEPIVSKIEFKITRDVQVTHTDEVI